MRRTFLFAVLVVCLTGIPIAYLFFHDTGGNEELLPLARNGVAGHGSVTEAEPIRARQPDAEETARFFNQLQEKKITGSLTLPLECVVLAPFVKEDGIPAADLLRQVPESLTLGSVAAEAKTVSFNTANRTLDLAPFLGEKTVGKTAFVYIPFSVNESGPLTFGFGADWNYEAYLDGTLVSSTMETGNKSWPPTIHDHLKTLDVGSGNHLLVIRFLSGKRTSLMAVGGPGDLRNHPKYAPTDPNMKKFIPVYSKDVQPGPPPGKKWKMAWNDEFDGAEIDTSKWQKMNRKWEWTGFKIEPSDAPLLDGSGALVLPLTKDPDGTVRFTKGVQSLESFGYGYYETRVKFSTQPGWWTAVWLSSIPWCNGPDPFVHGQEFDIFEDFWKPKTQNDISHFYHCSHVVGDLEAGTDSTGPLDKSVGVRNMLKTKQISRVSYGTRDSRLPILENYGGWHTVGLEWTPLEHIFYIDGQETHRQNYREVPITNVPLHYWITSQWKGKNQEENKSWLGLLSEAKLPDSLTVDYVRYYKEDTGGRKAPAVTLTARGQGPFKTGEPVTFDATATDPDGKIVSLLLFSMGRLRAETAADAATVKTTFTVDNLFQNYDNTVIAMAMDNDGLVGQSQPLKISIMSGKDFSGTAYQGKPQNIPGTILAERYDEGGNGVAFQAPPVAQSVRKKDALRNNELGGWPEAVEVGGLVSASWVTYEVDVAQAGDYEVELFMNRPDYFKTECGRTMKEREEAVRLSLVNAISKPLPLAKWTINTLWNSGPRFRQPQISLGKQRVTLPAGRQKLLFSFGDITVPHTYFCKLVVTPAKR